MIMANCQVAQKLVKEMGVDALIIYHPRPLEYNITNLSDYLTGLGVKFKP